MRGAEQITTAAESFDAADVNKQRSTVGTYLFVCSLSQRSNVPPITVTEYIYLMPRSTQ